MCISSVWRHSQQYLRLVSTLRETQHVRLTGLVTSAIGSLIVALTKSMPTSSIVYVSNSPSTLAKLNHSVQRSIGRGLDCNVFPSSSACPFLPNAERDSLYMGRLLSILAKLKQQTPQIVFASTASLCCTLPKPDLLREISLQVGRQHDRQQLMTDLLGMGYTRVPNVLEVGDLAVRGDITDVYPPNSPDSMPVRISWFDSTVESIKTFEPWSQRSIVQIADPILLLSLRPFSAIMSPDAMSSTIARLRSMGSELAQRAFWDADLDQFANGGWYRFQAWLEPPTELTWFDSYCSGSTVVVYEAGVARQLAVLAEIWADELSQSVQRLTVPPSQASLLAELVDMPSQMLGRLQAAGVRLVELS